MKWQPRHVKKSRQRLKELVQQIVEFIKDRYPDAEIFRRRPAPGIDASMEVVVPDGEFANLYNAVGQLEDEIFINEGYEIVMHVYERSEWDEMQRKRRELEEPTKR